MLKKTLKIFEYALFGIMVILILIFGYYIAQRLIHKDEPAKMFGYYMYEVTSWSMYNEESADSLSKGDLIFVKPRTNKDYEVGMVVTYATDSYQPTTHKIIEVNGEMITTQGINKEGNTSADTPFHVDNIIGEVKGVWKNYARFMDFILSPIGVVLILGGGFIIIEGLSIVNKKVFNKEEEKEN